MAECSKTAVIVAGKGCNCNIKKVAQRKKLLRYIGVSILEKVHGDVSSPTFLLAIRFCPQQGAKPQKGSRPDMLNQDKKF